MNPDANIDALRMCVVTHRFHVEAVYRFRYIGMRSRLKVLAIVRIPLMIAMLYNRVIFQSVSSAEINMILLRYKVVSWRVNRIGNDVAIPPGERRLTRLDPANILDLVWFVQICDNVRFDQRSNTIAYH